MIVTILLPLLLNSQIVLDRSQYAVPVQDSWVDTTTGRADSPIVLKQYKDGAVLVLLQPHHWEGLVSGLKANTVTILETPLSVAKGDRWTEDGGAIVVLMYSKPFKATKIDCAKPATKDLKCWSEWVKTRQDKPDMPPVQTWSVIVDKGTPTREKDYASKVTDHLKNRVKTLEEITIPKLRGDLFEAKLTKLKAATIYQDLDCKEASLNSEWISDKHYKDCKYAYDEYIHWVIEVGLVERRLVSTQMEVDSYVASIAAIKVIVDEQKEGTDMSASPER